MNQTRKDKSFKVLEDLWYKKLEATGFKDCEKNGSLKWSSNSQFTQSYKNNGIDGQESILNYHRVAGFFLHEHKFDNETDRFTWEQHCEAVPMRTISKNLKDKGIRIATTQVKEIVHRLRKQMFLVYNELNNDKE